MSGFSLFSQLFLTWLLLDLLLLQSWHSNKRDVLTFLKYVFGQVVDGGRKFHVKGTF